MLFLAVPNGSDTTLTFESFVTKPDLSTALRQHGYFWHKSAIADSMSIARV